jgi:putative toxin-antitoxin system antitoxin component (TIGR02293 family)
MSAKPLAEILERLKEFRKLDAKMPSQIGHQLREMYPDIVTSGVPERFTELIKRLDASNDIADKPDPSASLIRSLEIKTLADRVFGDEEKAENWLYRSNGSLAGQKPADLLKDELGTAVVREMLQQIDHGIFA